MNTRDWAVKLFFVNTAFAVAVENIVGETEFQNCFWSQRSIAFSDEVCGIILVC